jgi:hypothetical protein
MYSTVCYLYDKKHIVVIPDLEGDIFNIRWNPVYSRTIKIDKGVNNKILFQCLNQDQKPRAFSNDLIFRIINKENSEIVFSKSLELLDKPGRAVLELLAHETLFLPTGLHFYSLAGFDPDSEATNTSQSAIYTDDNSNSRGKIEILDSVFPKFIESEKLTIPDLSIDEESVTSAIAHSITSVVTFAIYFENFTGQITPESSIGDQWYEHDTQTYVNRSNTAILNVIGDFDKSRLNIKTQSGTIKTILYR